MKFYFEKAKCKISESINGFVLEVETDEEVEFTGAEGNDYTLMDECDEGIGPAPTDAFVIKNPK